LSWSWTIQSVEIIAWCSNNSQPSYLHPIASDTVLPWLSNWWHHSPCSSPTSSRFSEKLWGWPYTKFNLILTHAAAKRFLALQYFLDISDVILCSRISKKVLDKIFEWIAEHYFRVLTLFLRNVRLWWAAESVIKHTGLDFFYWQTRKCKMKQSPSIGSAFTNCFMRPSFISVSEVRIHQTEEGIYKQVAHVECWDHQVWGFIM